MMCLRLILCAWCKCVSWPFDPDFERAYSVVFHMQALEAARQTNDSIKDEIWVSALCCAGQMLHGRSKLSSFIKVMHSCIPVKLHNVMVWGAWMVNFTPSNPWFSKA